MPLAEFLVLLTAVHISLVLAELSLLRLEDLSLLVVIKLLIFCATTFASSCRPRLRSRLHRFRSIFTNGVTYCGSLGPGTTVLACTHSDKICRTISTKCKCMNSTSLDCKNIPKDRLQCISSVVCQRCAHAGHTA